MSTFSDNTFFTLPEELAQTYDVVSCLKYADSNATYLLRDKNTGHFYLLKTAVDSVFAKLLWNEKNILEQIHMQKDSSLAGSFPVPVFFRSYPDPDDTLSSTTYYIRTYIEGKTLEELCESNYKKPGLLPSQALDYIIALTELLHFLHNLNPPLIHRDIKPQNVVIDTEGGCHFIDLGISRFYQTSKRSDTFIMGTKLTAPPEQFGYQQTDIRSDLYSLGILLFYCLTGEYETGGQSLLELPNELQYIIKKAVMFDPDKRYQSTDELLPDLLRARYPDVSLLKEKNLPKKLKACQSLAVILLAVNIALASYTIIQNGRFRSLTSATANENLTSMDQAEPLSSGTLSGIQTVTGSTSYEFTEPLVEKAVRQQLNIEDRPLTEDDLAKVTELHIFGLQIFSDDSEVWFKGEFPWFYDRNTRESGLYLQIGTIASLEDVLHMPNLRTLSLYGQQIEDISILKDTSITKLGLGYNPLTDLTPLENNPSIQYLNLADTDISDLSVISTLPNLQELNISSSKIESLTDLKNSPIKKLNIYGLYLQDYTVLHDFPNLTELVVDGMSPELLSQMEGLPVTDLEVDSSNGLTLNDFHIFPQLQTLYLCGSHDDLLAPSQPVLPLLKDLSLVNLTLPDFYDLSSLDALTTLGIFGASCESYEGLDTIPKLSRISCQKEQKESIESQYPDNSYIFLYE